MVFVFKININFRLIFLNKSFRFFIKKGRLPYYNFSLNFLLKKKGLSAYFLLFFFIKKFYIHLGLKYGKVPYFLDFKHLIKLSFFYFFRNFNDQNNFFFFIKSF